MKKLIAILFLVLLLTGCMNPPPGTVMAEVDNKPVLAYDRDADSVADLDSEGNIEVVPGGAVLPYTEGADIFMPGTLRTVGEILGIPLLVGLGAAWRKYKFGRVFGNTVMTVQMARQQLKAGGFSKALDIVDATLGTQTKETTKAVRDIKETLGIKPLA